MTPFAKAHPCDLCREPSDRIDTATELWLCDDCVAEIGGYVDRLQLQALDIEILN